MKKYSFKDDYSEGCHPNILALLAETNLEQQNSYGDDDYSIKAKQLIKDKIQNNDAAIHFVTGGTQANLIVIYALLRPHESVIAATWGHIHVHEAGAIEATGHKINAVPTADGKLTPKDVQVILDEHVIIPHMVKPKMVYISNSTEIGTIYKKKELEALSAYCKENDLHLFMDGARLGAALTAKDNDLTLSDLSRLTDVFYIGGTKNGALIGEAIVINNLMLQNDFGYHLKQKGALLSKGRMLGVQFQALFEDNLFFKLAQHANNMAEKIVKALRQKGYSFFIKPQSNQIFPLFPNEVIKKLEKNYDFYIWEKVDEKSAAVRLVTSWATEEEMVDAFIAEIQDGLDGIADAAN